jgi:hypothetical protein
VAKRSVKKARERQGQQAARPPRADATPPSRAPSRSFWRGVLAASAVLIPLAVVAVLLVGGNDDEPAAPASAATATDDTQAEIARLRRQSAVRDKQQIEDLTGRARGMVDDFTPIIVGLGKTLPPDTQRIGPLASAAEVDDWRARVRRADEYFAETVSGETATNVARSGFSDAVDVLLETVETYKLALDNPSLRRPLLERVRDQRDLAARAWSTAATQLDVINIDAGFGHQHVVFPNSAGSAAAPPDELPEGTDATSPEGG